MKSSSNYIKILTIKGSNLIKMLGMEKISN